MNEEKLTHSVVVDTVSAILAAGLIAPFVSIIDKAIFSNASGKEKGLWTSVRTGLTLLVCNPSLFAKSPAFLWIWGVYSTTYIVANNCETICRNWPINPSLPIFLSSSGANIGASLIKDSYFTKAFGTGPAKAIPLRSYLCYGFRDSSTILASFIMPSHVSPLLVEGLGISPGYASCIAQLSTPCAMQILSTPFHLYGMDLYNHPAKRIEERISFIKREYQATVLARMARIMPAFGIGGIANVNLRRFGNELS